MLIFTSLVVLFSMVNMGNLAWEKLISILYCTPIYFTLSSEPYHKLKSKGIR
jgi:hypothetical protein